MKIGEYKQMMAYLTRPKNKDPIKESLKKSEFVKELKEKDIPKENLKPSGDILRNLLIEEMKVRDLDSDEIRYMMDTKPRNELKTQKINPSGQRILTKTKKPTTKVKPFIPKLPEFRIDPSPLPPPTPSITSEEEQKYLNIIRESEAEKRKNRSSGLAYLLGVDA